MMEMVYPQTIWNNYKVFEKVAQYENGRLSQKANGKAASGVPHGEAALLYCYSMVGAILQLLWHRSWSRDCYSPPGHSAHLHPPEYPAEG